jgi:membrane-associated phospholipid phosphatase
MEILSSIGSEIIIYLQQIGAWLLIPMEIFTFMGDEWFYLFIAPIIYWCVSPGLGLRLGILLMFSAGVNSILKFLLHTPRPYWIEENVIPYSTNVSFGAPSGHAQNAVVLWGFLAYWIQRTWVWVIAIFLIFMISISRLYLGVHYPHDTLAGWLVGGLILIAYIKYEKPFLHWLNTKSAIYKIGLAFLVSTLLLVIGIGLVPITQEWRIPDSLADPGATPPLTNDALNENYISGLITSVAALFGFSIGAIWISRYGGFSAEGKIWQRIVRSIIGIFGVGVIYAGLSYLFPEGYNLTAQIFRYIKYALLAIWIAGGAPILFIKLQVSTPAKVTSPVHNIRTDP